MTGALFYVQQLLGLGHDQRMAAIARNVAEYGIEVTFIAGGVPDAPIDLAGGRRIQLPPLKALSPAYDGLIGSDGAPPDDEYWAKRLRVLCEAFDASCPDALIIETFPFGRWPFRREILPLLERAKGRCRIFCSVRDILEPKSEPHRNRRIVELIEAYFDDVLVHADPKFVTLDETFSRASEIAARLCYTGYVSTGATAPRTETESGEIIVSAGGGATCAPLMRAAAAAAREDSRPWRFLIGPNCPPPVRAFLEGAPGLTAEPIRTDFRSLLTTAQASISQSGYNTTMDILDCGTPAIMVPHQGSGQMEQWHRAQRLEAHGRVTVIPEADVSGKSLLEALAAVSARQRTFGTKIDRDGAPVSARRIADACLTGI